MKSLNSVIIIILYFIFCNISKAQLDNESNFCLRSNYYNKTLESVKSIKKYDVEKGDTSLRIIKVNNGLYDTIIFPNNDKIIYTYDDEKRMVKVKSVITEENKKTQEVCLCNYDVKGRLNSFIIEYKTNGETDKIFRDNITYFNGDDSIKYVGEFYSMIISCQKKEGYDLRVIYDTLANIEVVEKYINENKIFTLYFDKGEKSIGTYYLYNEKGILKTKINEAFDVHNFLTIVGFTHYSYDIGDKLIEEKEFTGNSKPYSIRTILYNDKGLIHRDIIEYIDAQELKISYFEYEYWE